MEATAQLKDVQVDLIDPNPDNPRIVFRQEELDELLVSVRKYGIQVPITVYKEGKRYVLIDGERRWRTSKKLNLKTIPAIVQSKPTPLENLLIMFNIHALREQWDLFTISNKITKIISLLTNESGHEPNEIELSEQTGLNRGTIRRCKLLIDLPQKYKEIILRELEKPKSKQRLTEDFFIEMESCLKTVKRNFPDVITDTDKTRDLLIRKYQEDVIKNMVDFRKIGKLATSPKNVDFPFEKAEHALRRIFEDKKSSIEDVYNSTVSVLYDEKKLLSNFNNVLFYIRNLDDRELKDEDIRNSLIEIRDAIREILDEE